MKSKVAPRKDTLSTCTVPAAPGPPVNATYSTRACGQDARKAAIVVSAPCWERSVLRCMTVVESSTVGQTVCAHAGPGTVRIHRWSPEVGPVVWHQTLTPIAMSAVFPAAA